MKIKFLLLAMLFVCGAARAETISGRVLGPDGADAEPAVPGWTLPVDDLFDES